MRGPVDVKKPCSDSLIAQQQQLIAAHDILLHRLSAAFCVKCLAIDVYIGSEDRRLKVFFDWSPSAAVTCGFISASEYLDHVQSSSAEHNPFYVLWHAQTASQSSVIRDCAQ